MLRAFIIVLVLTAFAMADQKRPPAPVDLARDHAAHAPEKNAAKADIELVRALVEQAGAQYTAKQYDDSAKSLDEAKQVLAKGLASAQQQKHDLKQCDLILDKVERRLRDYSHGFSTVDRPRVEALLKDVGNTREKLLQMLFSK
ncbi:MAG TPA: hypothetical protein VGC88_10770 [Terriglobales bacterium]|jgi:hypothetical protein